MAQRQVIWPFFFIALFFSLTSLLPIMTFVPFLIITYYRHSLAFCLWVAAGCGLILDLLSNTSFGIYTLNYVGITFLLFRYRIYFVEKPIGLFSLTLIFSILSSLVTKLFLWIAGISIPFTFKGIVTDFLVMPLFDGVYALLFFSCPLTFYRLVRRLWFRFLFFREEFKRREEEKIKSHGK